MRGLNPTNNARNPRFASLVDADFGNNAIYDWSDISSNGSRTRAGGPIFQPPRFPRKGRNSTFVNIGGRPAATNSMDQIAVSGRMDLAGTLEVRLVGNFQPVVGDVYPVFSFGSESNDFQNYSGLNLSNGLFLTPGVGSRQFTLTVLDKRPQIALSTGWKDGSGTIHWLFTNTVGQNLVISDSTNLIQWQPLQTNMACGLTYEWIDATVRQKPMYFYRLMPQ